MKKGPIFAAAVLWTTAGLGCQTLPPTAAVGEDQEGRKVVSWRLVERTYGQADPERKAGGDGQIPGESRLLLYEPVFEEVRIREFGAIHVSLVCDHEIRIRIVGSLSRCVGEPVTAQCRIEGPESIYHELAIAPTTGGMQVLEVKGAARLPRRPGLYLVPGNRVFEVVFTSLVACRGSVGISVIRERLRERTSVATLER